MRYANLRRILILSIAVLLTGCVSFGATDGVDNLWRDVPADAFEKSITTQADVLELLGPPSQLISLKDQIVFYYLTEEMSGEGKIFIVWNQASAKSKYDRAIFFFDAGGVLQEFSFSKEQIER